MVPMVCTSVCPKKMAERTRTSYFKLLLSLIYPTRFVLRAQSPIATMQDYAGGLRSYELGCPHEYPGFTFCKCRPPCSAKSRTSIVSGQLRGKAGYTVGARNGWDSEVEGSECVNVPPLPLRRFTLSWLLVRCKADGGTRGAFQCFRFFYY